MIPRPSRISFRRASSLLTAGVEAATSSATRLRVAVDVVVADGQLSLDEVPVVVGEETSHVDVVTGEGPDRGPIAPQRDDLDLARVGAFVTMPKDDHVLVSGRGQECGDAGLLDVVQVGVMVG